MVQHLEEPRLAVVSQISPKITVSRSSLALCLGPSQGTLLLQVYEERRDPTFVVRSDGVETKGSFCLRKLLWKC